MVRSIQSWRAPCLSEWDCPPASRTDSAGAWFKYRAVALGVGGDGQSLGQFGGFMEVAVCEDTLLGLFFLTLLTKTTYFNIPYTRDTSLAQWKRTCQTRIRVTWITRGPTINTGRETRVLRALVGCPQMSLSGSPLCAHPLGSLPTHCDACCGKPEKAVMSGKQTQHQSPGTNSAPQWVDYLLCQIHSNRSLSVGSTAANLAAT